MDERAALGLVGDALPAAGDDCAVVGSAVVTTDMLHETTDFPPGTTRYTAGWRAVGASLSDVAAMGADATAAVAVYGAPSFEEDELEAFLRGARAVCETADARYVGGDLDGHEEFTVATTALGETGAPVRRTGATPGEAVCVTGKVGRSAGGFRLFDDDPERANRLFRFEPRVATGRAVAPHASAMMDSSDGVARSLHQLAEASGCGFAVEYDRLPVHGSVATVADDAADERELAVHFGEDFELVFTTAEPERAREASSVPVSVVGEVTETDIEMDGEPLADRGYTH
ncbi:thiamine-phosphate kinase [Halobacteriales archaeon SW_6_65_46]|nr:MAG: thiamine-phosphate kinase [Halobacteriales archaeon SW_6_65_46]